MEKIKINGAEKEFGELPANLAELLERLKVDASTVVAEVDGEIIERSRFSQTALKQGQAVELIRFVPGG